jgi:hypothetical protein
MAEEATDGRRGRKRTENVGLSYFVLVAPVGSVEQQLTVLVWSMSACRQESRRESELRREQQAKMTEDERVC